MNTISKPKWRVRWEQLEAVARTLYSDLTDEELRHIQGQHDQLVSLIQDRTGESRQTIETKLKDAMPPADPALS
jgi:uncharacterized protein YjbJ (UPF0337 family)